MRVDLGELGLKEALKDKAELLKKHPRAKEQAIPVEVLSKVDVFMYLFPVFLNFQWIRTNRIYFWNPRPYAARAYALSCANGETCC